MFGATGRTALEVVQTCVEPWLRCLEAFDELPKGFWQDPYVLGFMSNCLKTLATLATGGQIDGSELAEVVLSSFKELSGQDGDAIADMVIALGKSKDRDFALGFENAEKFMCIAHGIPGFEDDPDVLKARQLGAAMSADLGAVGPITPQAETSTMLFKMLFYDVVLKRLGKEEQGVTP